MNQTRHQVIGVVLTCSAVVVLFSQPAWSQKQQAPKSQTVGMSGIVVGGSSDCKGVAYSSFKHNIIKTDLAYFHTALFKKGLISGENETLPMDIDNRTLITRISETSVAKGLFFIYSGHGDIISDASDPTKKSGESYICIPSDNTEKKSGRVMLSDIFRSANPKWTVALVNSCFSGYSDLSEKEFPTAIITSVEQEQTALGKKVNASEGTIVARAFDSVVNEVGFNCDGSSAEKSTPLRAGASDTNCDGILSDEELLEGIEKRVYRCPNALFAEAPLRLNIRRNTSVQLPVMAFDSCDFHEKFRQIKSLLPRLTGAHRNDIEELVSDHEKLALALHGEISDPPRPLKSSSDFFWVSADTDPAISKIAENSGLLAFPGGLEEATAFAEFTMGPQVFLLDAAPDGRWLRIISLRSGRLIRTVTRPPEVSQNSRGIFLDKIERVLARLSKRVTAVKVDADGWYELRFLGALPEGAVKIPLDHNKSITFRRESAVPIPCREEDGQCYRINP